MRDNSNVNIVITVSHWVLYDATQTQSGVDSPGADGIAVWVVATLRRFSLCQPSLTGDRSTGHTLSPIDLFSVVSSEPILHRWSDVSCMSGRARICGAHLPLEVSAGLKIVNAVCMVGNNEYDTTRDMFDWSGNEASPRLILCSSSRGVRPGSRSV